MNSTLNWRSYTVVLWRKRGGKWTRGDHFHQRRSVTSVFVECDADGHAPRRYRSYFQSCGELPDEAQLSDR